MTLAKNRKFKSSFNHTPIYPYIIPFNMSFVNEMTKKTYQFGRSIKIYKVSLFISYKKLVNNYSIDLKSPCSFQESLIEH